MWLTSLFQSMSRLARAFEVMASQVEELNERTAASMTPVVPITAVETPRLAEDKVDAAPTVNGTSNGAKRPKAIAR